MEVLLANEYGFCFGVERAVEMVEDALEGGGSVRTLGPLIHNTQEMQRLECEGVSTVQDPAEVSKNEIAVIRAHGVTPLVQLQLEARAAQVVDATCPFVTRVQRLAERAAKQGRHVVVAGNPDHPEMIGVVGYAPNNTFVVRTLNLKLSTRFVRRRATVRMPRADSPDWSTFSTSSAASTHRTASSCSPSARNNARTAF